MDRDSIIVLHGFLALPNREKKKVVDAMNEYFDSSERRGCARFTTSSLNCCASWKIGSNVSVAAGNDQVGNLRQIYWKIVSLTEPGFTRVRDSFFTRSDARASTRPLDEL